MANIPPFTFAVSVTCHAWNGDRSRVAICPNTNEIQIYVREGNEFVLEYTLAQHDSVVTGIDWAPNTNRIVSCSQDRNAYVWTFANGEWKPALVILRINRAATSCKWSPLENKFAVASGAKLVCICYFEEDNDWWVAKHIKKHKSTVLTIDWHPNNVLLATGSSDFKARVVSAAVRGVDKRVDSSPLGAIPAFGEVAWEYGVQGWVHTVKWSPAGNRLMIASHDSSIHFAEWSGSAEAQVQSLRTRRLPFLDGIWAGNDLVIVAGHDCKPASYGNQGGKWAFARELDVKPAAGGQAEKSGAMAMFQNKVDRGESSTETTLDTRHQNAINCVVNLGNGEFTTTGMDGAICFWKL